MWKGRRIYSPDDILARVLIETYTHISFHRSKRITISYCQVKILLPTRCPKRSIASRKDTLTPETACVGGKPSGLGVGRPVFRLHWLGRLRLHLLVLQLFAHTESGHLLLLYLPPRRVLLKSLSWLPITYRMKSKFCEAESKLFTICPLFPCTWHCP